MRATAVITGLIVAGAIASAQTPRTTTAMAFDDFRAQWRRTIESAGIAGAAIAVVEGDRTVFADGEGVADVVTARPVDQRTIFHWASITKTFTAVAIMQLRDGGRLSLDDAVVRYLPELRAVHDPYGPVEAITIRHLLSHSAGFRSPTWPWGGDRRWHPFEPTSWAQLAAMLPYTEVEFAPGSRFQYSNPGIVFLGRIIEQLAGEDFEVYVDKHILRPLEMRESYFDATPPYLLAHKSHSYVTRDGVRTERPFDADTGVTVSNGGLNAPVADLAKWVSFLLGRPADATRRARYDTVLSRASIEEMWRPVVPAETDGEAPDRDVRMGLGFFVERHFDRTCVGHGGDQNGFISHFYLDPAAGLGYVTAFNTLIEVTPATPRGTKAIDREIRDRVFTEVFPALRGR